MNVEMNSRLFLKTPSSARERAIFSPGKDGEAGDVCSIVDAAGCSQAEEGPIEARSGFQTEPGLYAFLGVLLACFASAHGQWTEPEHLAEINTAHVDKSPFLSFDGTTLYFSRQAGPGWYYTRIYQATRLDPNGPFSSVTEVSSLNYFGGHVDGPWVSPDNLRMYYYRTEPGAQSRLKVSYRNSVIDMWPEGVNVNELNGLGRLAS
ncbi:MAG: PD40 domain-containing protein, partial [Planctomycetes bacterium]|nr:PD40 domain-containing protein [Planctomycetota bacterium]